MKKKKSVLVVILTVLVFLLLGYIIYDKVTDKNAFDTSKIQKTKDLYTIKYSDMQAPGKSYIIVFDSNYDIKVSVIKYCSLVNCKSTKEEKKYFYSDTNKKYIKESLNRIFADGTNEKNFYYQFLGFYYNDVLLMNSIINENESILSNRIDNNFKIVDSRENKRESVCNKESNCSDFNCEKSLLNESANKIQIEFEDGKILSLEEVLTKKLLTVEQINTVNLICY